MRCIWKYVVTDLSTESFIGCLKRFTARKGFPLLFLSDNGKTFKAGTKFIKAVFKEQVVQDHLSGQLINWIFIIERAP